jgi:hypothetical protein
MLLLQKSLDGLGDGVVRARSCGLGQGGVAEAGEGAIDKSVDSRGVTLLARGLRRPGGPRLFELAGILSCSMAAAAWPSIFLSFMLLARAAT